MVSPALLQLDFTKMSTYSNMQQQLVRADSHLPTHNLYGYGKSAMLLYPRVTALKEEFQLNDKTE